MQLYMILIYQINGSNCKSLCSEFSKFSRSDSPKSILVPPSLGVQLRNKKQPLLRKTECRRHCYNGQCNLGYEGPHLLPSIRMR